MTIERLLVVLHPVPLREIKSAGHELSISPAAR
jgi:hypothetical protein